MFTAILALASDTYQPRNLRLRTALGEPWRLDAEFVAPEPIEPDPLVGAPAALRLTTEHVEHTARGIVTEITAAATAQAEPSRLIRVTIEPAIAALRFRRLSRIFRNKAVPEILRAILAGAGIAADDFAIELSEEYPVREHTTQYRETDLAFLRRLCEEAGILYRFDPTDTLDKLVWMDSAASAREPLAGPLPLVDASALALNRLCAWDARWSRRCRPGKVTLRDHDPQKPKVLLEGKAQSGTDWEKGLEVYAAPAGFTTEPAAKKTADLAMERLRADALTVSFATTAISLVAGTAVKIEAHGAPTVSSLEGAYFVTDSDLVLSPGKAPEARVHAVPKEVPYRLPAVTPKPRILGVQSAIVTGPAGEEIHVDAQNRVRVRFLWDLEGPTDDKSSLPVRVMQPNLPGSMLIPRVGWEVMVAFEDGDPDRPYVLGRPYNAKQPPPFGLPANKTMTALSTSSSPGGKAQNALHMDDAAGRQHMVFHAGFGKSTDVGNDMLEQTVGFAKTSIGGSQSWSIGGDETVSVGNALTVVAGSQSTSVGGSQDLQINAAGVTAVGSETVSVGGALIELVGDPKTGLAHFAQAAALAGVGEIPVVGSYLSTAAGTVKAIAEGYAHGGSKGALLAAGQSVTGLIGGQIPGGDALVAAANGAGLTPWSEKAQEKEAEEAAGGGTGGAGAAGAGSAAAAPGHRKTIVDGSVSETIGGLYSVSTPGSIRWTTLGPSTIAVGGAHITEAVRVHFSTAGASADTVSAVSIQSAGPIGRHAKAASNLHVGGSWQSVAGGPFVIQAGGNVDLSAGGALSIEGGAVVFKASGATLVVHGGGLLLKASKVTVNGTVVHGGSEDVG
ncbi:MAG: type VI secretion system tip protein TssI/VgrG [Polyangiaceae bacterium]